jgi:hypothetical protein
MDSRDDGDADQRRGVSLVLRALAKMHYKTRYLEKILRRQYPFRSGATAYPLMASREDLEARKRQREEKAQQERESKARNAIERQANQRKMGLSADSADQYAAAIVRADMEQPGDEDVFRKVALMSAPFAGPPALPFGHADRPDMAKAPAAQAPPRRPPRRTPS